MPGQAETNGRGTTGVVLRPQQQLTEQAQRRPPDWVAYAEPDGSEDLGKAGWAYTVLIGGDAIGDEGAALTSEGYGPVVTSAAHPAYLGARRHTNNTAELTALAELLRALLSSSPQRAGSRGVVRTDSEYAAACMMGRVTPKTNRQLAERLRSLWQRLRAKHTVTWRHVAGHSGNKWNDYVDKLAARGRVTEAQKLPSGRELVLPRSPSLCAVWRTPVCHARGPRLRGYVAGRLPPCAG